jgi:hypothetical protein
VVTITIGQLTFDHIDYDPLGDVLYLHIGEPQPGEETDETPEGHAGRFNASDAVVGVTILNPRWLLDEGQPTAISRVCRSPAHLSLLPLRGSSFGNAIIGVHEHPPSFTRVI